MKNKVSQMTPTAYASIALAAIAVLLVYAGIDLPIASAMFPITILSVLAILNIALLINEIYKISPTKEDATESNSRKVKKVLSSLACMVVYIILANVLGFFTTTFFMVPVISYLFGYKNIKKSATSAALYTVLLYIIFDLAMGRELPHGILM